MFLTALAFAAAATQSPAVMFRGDPAHTGVSGPVLEGQPGIKWEYRTRGAVRSSPAVTASTVFIGSNDSTLYALDRATGRVRWRYAAGSAVSSSPAVAGGLVIAQSAAGVIFAVAEQTGRPRWRVQTGPLLPHDFDRGAWDYYVSSPVIAGDMVIVGAGDGAVYALDLRTGAQHWRSQTRGRVRSTPAVHEGLVVAGSFDARVYAFDLATGAERWVGRPAGDTLVSARWGFDRRAVQSSPAIANDAVFIGSRDGALYGIEFATGQLRFRATHRGSWVVGSPAVREGRAWVGSSDGKFVHALDVRTGADIWRTPTRDNVLSSPLLAGDQLIFGTFDGLLLSLDAVTGARRWMVPLGAPAVSSPATYGRELYLGLDDGRVVALHEVTPRPARLAVFWDTTQARFAFMPGGRMARDHLEQRGYAVLDAAGLARFMAEHISDGAPSAVVFALDHVPATVMPVAADTVLFRRYLEAGGKVVWLGMAVGGIRRDSAGTIVGFTAERMDSLIGVPAAAINFNQHPYVPTASGAAWGLAPSGHGESPLPPSAVSEVLALNEDGMAAAWVRRYPRSAPGMGFVQLWGGNGVTAERLPMISAVAEYGLLRPAQQPRALEARVLQAAPALDGSADVREYGAPSISFSTAAGLVNVWLARHGGWLYLAAEMPDSSYYWGDDFVVTLDPQGRGGEQLAIGSRQWYLRRTLDSSVVLEVTPETQGRWMAPGRPTHSIGAQRTGPDWEVASSSSSTGWTVELRIRAAAARVGTALPRLALRTYNDAPRGWWSWPGPPAGTPAQRVERTPALWEPINFQQ